MAVRYTDAPARRAELLRLLRADGYLTSRDLAGAVGVSEMTIRRDLARLENDGTVRRVPGGATLTGTHGTETFDRRQHREQAPKQAIARTALSLLNDAETIALDAGTTVAPAATLMPAGMRIVSHSLPVLAACEHRDDIEVIGLGGTYHHQTRSFGGPQTRLGAEEVAVDVALLSAVAVSDDGLYCTVSWEAEMKQAFHARAERTILLVDHTKASLRAPLRFLRWGEVDTIVTDRGLDARILRRWRSAGAHVVLAQP